MPPCETSHLFQPPDIQSGPHGYVKCFMKDKLLWYVGQVKSALDNGEDINEIKVSMKLSVLKPIYERWLLKMCYYMTSPTGKDVSQMDGKLLGLLVQLRKA